MVTDSTVSVAIPLVFLVVLKLSDMAREMDLVAIVERGKSAWGLPFFWGLERPLPPTGRLVHIHSLNILILNATILLVFLSGLSVQNLLLAALAFLIWIMLPVFEIDEYDIIQTRSHSPPVSFVSHAVSAVLMLGISGLWMYLFLTIHIRTVVLSGGAVIGNLSILYPFSELTIPASFSTGIVKGILTYASLRAYYLVYFSWIAAFLGYIANEVGNRESTRAFKRDSDTEIEGSVPWEEDFTTESLDVPNKEALGTRSKQILYSLKTQGGAVSPSQIDAASPDFLIQKSFYELEEQGLVENTGLDEFRITSTGREYINQFSEDS